MVAHDVGAQTAYSYAAAHPNNVSKLVLMDFPFPGFLPPEFGPNGPWWFGFYQTPDVPEYLIEGKEKEYLSWFIRGLEYNPSAITDSDIDVFVTHAPRLLVDYYYNLNTLEVFPTDAEQNKE